MLVKAKKSEVLKIEDFNVNALEQIKGKKEHIAKVIKENPYVAITDNKSYEEAKKNRTTLRTNRTDLEKEEKAILTNVKNIITEPVKKIYSEFKESIAPAEEKQQTEVKRYEDIKEEERKEHKRIEEERKQTHRNNIELFVTSNKENIEKLTFEQAKTFELNFTFEEKVFTTETFEEFDDVFEAKIEVLKSLLSEKKASLQQVEDIRLRQEELDRIEADNQRKDSIKKSIEEDYNKWQSRISTEITFENHEKIYDLFKANKLEDLDEFQSDYDTKRATLTKMFDAKISFLKDAEKLRSDKEELEKQKLEARTIERRNELVALGIVEVEDMVNQFSFNETPLLTMFHVQNFDNDMWSEAIKKVKLDIESLSIVEEPIEVAAEQPNIINEEVFVEEMNVTDEIVVGEEIADRSFETEPKSVKANTVIETVTQEVDFEEISLIDLLLKAKSTICSLKLSMLAHPDCTEGSEFDDYTSLAQETENDLENYIKNNS